MRPVVVERGEGPVILAMPHVGTGVPPVVGDLLNARGRDLADTDWHVDRLYDGLLPGATVVRAEFHRYVIDANRAPDDESLYPGQNTTGLVPATDFEGRPIWVRPVTAAEVTERLELYHAPYHAALVAEIARVKARHGVAILWDCHSIRSRIPFLFEGLLPDLNIGTNGGGTCDPRIEGIAARIAAGSGYSHVVNGRFRGGWTTRHYGRPGDGIHAIQMEIAQSAYLAAETAPWDHDGAKAAPLRRVLSAMLNEISALAPSLQVSS